MPLPSTGYITATATNPSAALNEFPLVFNLANAGASFWNEVDTSDGTKGRAAKDDGTELPVDWIDFDSVNNTGIVRVRWSGTLATSGTQTIRLYPPKAANASVLPGDTFGSHNVYDNGTQVYIPVVGTTYTDRTVNGNNATGSGTLTGVTGPINDAIRFATRNAYLDIGNLDPSMPYSLEMWLRWTGTPEANEDTMMSTYNASTGGALMWRYNSDTQVIDLFHTATASVTWNQALTSTWTHLAVTSVSGAQTLYVNGVGTTAAGGMTTQPNTSSNNLYAGNTPHSINTDGFRGDMAEIKVHTVARSEAWFATEHAQTSNNAAFWSAITWNALPAGPTGIGGSRLKPKLLRV